MATWRFRRGSWAVYTTPMPPWPSAARMVYGPMVEPGVKDIFVETEGRVILCPGGSWRHLRVHRTAPSMRTCAISEVLVGRPSG